MTGLPTDARADLNGDELVHINSPVLVGINFGEEVHSGAVVSQAAQCRVSHSGPSPSCSGNGGRPQVAIVHCNDKSGSKHAILNLFLHPNVKHGLGVERGSPQGNILAMNGVDDIRQSNVAGGTPR